MGEMTMKRKLWIILSLVLVLSIAYSSSAFAVNPVVDTFLGGRVDLNSMVSETTGYGTLKYSNSEHQGTIYTNYIQITYTYVDIAWGLTRITKTKSASVQTSIQNGQASVSYDAPAGYKSYSVTNLGKVNQLGEIWVGNTDLIYYN
jgi:hypothetical protein